MASIYSLHAHSSASTAYAYKMRCITTLFTRHITSAAWSDLEQCHPAGGDSNVCQCLLQPSHHRAPASTAHINTKEILV